MSNKETKGRRMILMVSTDLGQSYFKAKEGSYKDLKKIALDFDSEGSCRWVITNDKDDPKFWCNYIEHQLHTAKNAMIASSDKYLLKIARRKGIKCMDGKEFFKGLGINNIPKIDINPDTVKRTLKGMQELVESGAIEMVESTFDDSELGKEISGDLKKISKED